MKLVSRVLAMVMAMALAGCGGPPPVNVPVGVQSQAADQVREGIIELEDGAEGAAKDRFETALALDPKLAAAHYNLAIVLHKEGKHAEANQHLKEAAALAPDNPAITKSDFYQEHAGK